MYDGPIREGSRGGRDQFSWENVKGDKDREFYLGHSVKALVGHWQKNKDPYWYARNKKSRQAELAAEVKAVKEREDELMLEALGMKKTTKKQTTDFGKRLQQYEVAELLKRRDKEDGEQEIEDLGPRGLGFRRTASTLAATATHEVLEGVGISDSDPTTKPPNIPSTAHRSLRAVGEKSEKRKRDKIERKALKKRKKEKEKHQETHRHHKHEQRVADDHRERLSPGRHEKRRSHRSRSPYRSRRRG